MPGTSFGALLDSLIRARFGDVPAFCKAVASAGHKVDKSDVYRIIKGSVPIRRPPQDQLEAWCAVLRLTPKESRFFRHEALLTHTPDEIVDWIRSQGAREQRLSREVARLKRNLNPLSTPRPPDAPDDH